MEAKEMGRGRGGRGERQQDGEESGALDAQER